MKKLTQEQKDRICDAIITNGCTIASNWLQFRAKLDRVDLDSYASLEIRGMTWGTNLYVDLAARQFGGYGFNPSSKSDRLAAFQTATHEMQNCLNAAKMIWDVLGLPEVA
jgi:hypothetical protein